MDAIVIRDLTVSCRVGVSDAERTQPQRLSLTVEMAHNFEAAAAADDLGQTVNYDAVCQRLIGFGEAREWKLIETLAVDIASMILGRFKPASVTVEVKKFIIPQARYVSVRVTRPLPG